MGVTYFPLVFVYLITTWAVWVEASVGFLPTKTRWVGSGTSFTGVTLYLLLNWCYTAAVFTNPGTTKARNGYSSLPTHSEPLATNFTVKSNGELRYCKKCQARKPDRAHHCSTCQTCVLKMDHHCPWLATCVGLRNYKAFLLFLSYTTLFCFTCFWVSGNWIWGEILKGTDYNDSMLPVNCVMLAVISGIIGLLLAGFTCWHIILATRGQTTIECLEKTRYLSPLRNSKPKLSTEPISQTQRSTGSDSSMRDTEQTSEYEHPSFHPAERVNFNDHERIQSQRRYEEYLDEQDSEKLPSAFDFGWRKNWLDLFGPNKLLWPFPVVTTVGDGWHWEPSHSWIEARERITRQREEQRRRENAAGWGREDSAPSSARFQGAARHYVRYSSGTTAEAHEIFNRPISKAERILGQENKFMEGVLMDTLRPSRSREDHELNFNSEEYWIRGRNRGSSVLSPKSIGGTSILLGKNFANKDDEPKKLELDDGVD
ncbi:Palmitoyltransferase [Podosphaera aphanis]|nr:Palmitoyltransferase [Podosphaera aphanis]